MIANTDGVSGRRTGGGSHLAGRGPHPERERGLPGHRHSGGDVEGRGGDFKSPPHLLHHLPYINKIQNSMLTDPTTR